MSHQRSSKLIALLVVLMLLNTFVMKIEVVDMMLVIIGLGLVIYLNKEILKKLSIWQNIGILVLFIVTVALLVCFFYFVASPVVHMISIGWIRYVVQIILIIGALIPAIGLLFKGMSKLTHGKFPITDSELEKDSREHVPNERVEQLVRNGQVVKAVKLSRELYGYSLVEAKRYVDSLR